MIVVDILIVAVIGFEVYMGWQRGFIIVGIDLIGLVMAALAASVFYRPLTGVVVKIFHLIPSLAGIVTYGLVLMLVEVTYLVSIRWLLRRLPRKLMAARWNLIGGSLLNGFKASLIIALSLVIFSGLPLNAAQKNPIINARIPRLLLADSAGLQPVVDHLLGLSIADSLNFFSVKPESRETINLGFRTTSTKPDEAGEVAMLELVNNERISRGLKALKPNPAAANVARAQARDMLARGYFSHINPEGQDPFQRLKTAKVRYVAAGENLALAPTLPLAHSGLMHSPGHRANILSPDFNTVGIGVIDAGGYGLMVAQEFTD